MRSMRFTRHARNNMRLYKISEQDILKVLNEPDSTSREGCRLTALRQFSNKFSGYALKVVYDRSRKDTTVITAYPLKRKHWR